MFIDSSTDDELTERIEAILYFSNEYGNHPAVSPEMKQRINQFRGSVNLCRDKIEDDFRQLRRGVEEIVSTPLLEVGARYPNFTLLFQFIENAENSLARLKALISSDQKELFYSFFNDHRHQLANVEETLQRALIEIHTAQRDIQKEICLSEDFENKRQDYEAHQNYQGYPDDFPRFLAEELFEDSMWTSCCEEIGDLFLYSTEIAGANPVQANELDFELNFQWAQEEKSRVVRTKRCRQ